MTLRLLPWLLRVALVCACLMPSVVTAQGTSEGLEIGGGRTLGLGDVIRSVDLHHPNLDAARAQVRSAEGEALAARGAFDLTVRADGFVAPVGYYDWGRASVGLEQPTPLWGASFYAGWRIGQGNSPDYYGNYDTLDGGELRVGGRVPLWRDGPTDARRARRSRADQNTEARRAAIAARQLILRRQASGAYFRWVAAGRRYLIVARLLEIALSRDAQIAAKVAAGHLPPVEALENRRVIVARRTSLVSARRALERAAIGLSLHLRDRDGDPRVADASELPREIPIPAELRVDLPRALDEVWERRPESERFRALRLREQVSLELAENQRAPRIDLGVGAAFDVGSGTASEQDVLGPPVVEATLSFALPLQMRGARGAIAGAEAGLDALSAEARFTRDKIEADVRDAHSAVRAAHESVTLARESAEVATAVADAERARFELGATQLFVVNLREEGAAAASALLVDAEASLHIAHADWRGAMAEDVMAADSRGAAARPRPIPDAAGR